jgi:hypothetical protein
MTKRLETQLLGMKAECMTEQAIYCGLIVM